MKLTLQRAYLALLATGVLALSSCLKGTKVDNSPPTIVTTDVVLDAANKTAWSGGTEYNQHVISEAGLAYSSSNSTPTKADTHTTDTLITYTFASKVTGVTAGATYYFRAYATSASNTSYGNVVKFVTPSNLSLQFGSASTLAGNSEGFTNGTGTAATFNKPAGAAVDVSGNLYVADSFNNAIRKISPAGVVTTFAGTGVVGYKDGAGAEAQFYVPVGVVIDSKGNLFVLEKGNNIIRKITPAGVVTTFAGNGAAGYTNGTGTAVSFNSPTAIAIDGSDNLYIADAGNNRIRKVTAAGVATSIAGNGTLGYLNGTVDNAEFNKPTGIAVDAAGNVYLAEQNTFSVRKINTSTGIVTTFAGGNVNKALVGKPTGVSVGANGNYYITDADGRIITITKAGVLYVTAGKTATTGSANGAGAAASFNKPQAVAVDAVGNLYVCDYGNNRIRKINL